MTRWVLAFLLLAASTLALPDSGGWTLAFLRAYTPPPEESATDDQPVAKPADPAEDHPARQALQRSHFHDPGNPDILTLQAPAAAMTHLPRDVNGFPDWMKSLNQGLIQPRAGLKADAKMNVLELDVVMKNTKEMPWVKFPHRSHTLWLDCSNCHPEPFKEKAGSTPIQMADLFRGRYCGMCHDRVAFITWFSCYRCHSVPQPGQAGQAPAGRP